MRRKVGSLVLVAAVTYLFVKDALVLRPKKRLLRWSR